MRFIDVAKRTRSVVCQISSQVFALAILCSVVPHINGVVHAQDLSAVEIGKGVLDSEKDTAQKWLRINFTSQNSAIQTIKISWDNDADVRFRVRRASDDVDLGLPTLQAKMGHWVGELEADTDYYIGLWSKSGATNYTASLASGVTYAMVGRGILDSTNATAPRFERLRFESIRTGAHTIRVSWGGDANIGFNVLTADGQRLNPSVVQGTNPGIWVGELDAHQDYIIAIWSAFGTANYTASITTDKITMPRAITAQPTDQFIDAGEIATFSVTATGIGRLRYQWFANDQAISGETSDTLAIGPVTLAEDDNLYRVDVTDNIGTVNSDNATLAVTGHCEPAQPQEPAGTEQLSMSLSQVMDYGIADIDAVLGQKHNVVKFVPEESGPVTIELRWEGTQPMMMAVFNSDTDERLADDNNATIQTRVCKSIEVSTKSITLDLDENKQYHATAWLEDGTAEWVLRKIQVVDNPDFGLSDEPDAGIRPNIVLINTDDQRKSTLEFLPAIQEFLVEKGVTYTNTIVPTPSCCPSRATTLTGQYVHNNNQFQQLLPNQPIFEKTFQKYLKQAGYFTGHAGKYLHWLDTTDPVPPYWDRWTYISGGFYDVGANFDGTSLSPGGYTTDIIFERTKDYLRGFEAQNDDKPWFVYIAPLSPHRPATAEYDLRNEGVPELSINSLAYLEADISDKPEFLKFRFIDDAGARDVHEQRARNLLSLDREVRQFIEYLEASGELERTLIIFTSDNGYILGEHQTRGKFTPYRDSVQVPLVISWPGNVPENVVSEAFVSHVDIAPTILGAARVNLNNIPALFDGKNIFAEARDTFYMEYFLDPASNGGRVGDWASLRTNAYQYTEWYSLEGTDEVSFREYYDMVNDPYQLENLYGNDDPSDDPDYTDLSAELLEARSCSGGNCP